MRILLIEDETVYAHVLLRTLTRAGFHVEIASTLAQALALLKANIILDCIVLDLGLPDSEGIATLGTILQACRDYARQPPVIVVTAKSEDAEFALECTRAGAADYLRKDTVDMAHLIWSIRREVEKARLSWMTRA